MAKASRSASQKAALPLTVRVIVAEPKASARGVTVTVRLAPLPPRVAFRRDQPLAHREDWGLTLGPLQLPQPVESIQNHQRPVPRRPHVQLHKLRPGLRRPLIRQ